MSRLAKNEPRAYGLFYGRSKAPLVQVVPVPAMPGLWCIVTPAKWKLAVGVPTGADKEAGRLRALQLFPEQAANLARKKDHARGDALLIAYYGMRRAS